MTMLPFDFYPHGGRQLPGMVKGTNARHQYGLELMRLTRYTRVLAIPNLMPISTGG